MASKNVPIGTSYWEGGASTAFIALRDRIAIRSLSDLFAGNIRAGFLSACFAIFAVAGSFARTRIRLIPGSAPLTATIRLRLAVPLIRAGFAAGALAPPAQRHDERDMLLIMLVVAGFGVPHGAHVPDHMSLVNARTFTGIGVGADLARVNASINETAPVNGRDRYTALMAMMSASGAFLGIWLGLLRTIRATRFPLDLPFWVAEPSCETRRRWTYGPERFRGSSVSCSVSNCRSLPRRLIAQGWVDEAMADPVGRVGGGVGGSPSFPSLRFSVRLEPASMWAGGSPSSIFLLVAETLFALKAM